MDRRVTSPTWGPPPPCKQALKLLSVKAHWACATHLLNNRSLSFSLIMGWAIMLNSTIFVYFTATFTSLFGARLPTPYRSRVHLKNNDSPPPPVFATLSTKNVLRADKWRVQAGGRVYWWRHFSMTKKIRVFKLPNYHTFLGNCDCYCKNFHFDDSRKTNSSGH